MSCLYCGTDAPQVCLRLARVRVKVRVSVRVGVGVRAGVRARARARAGVRAWARARVGVRGLRVPMRAPKVDVAPVQSHWCGGQMGAGSPSTTRPQLSTHLR